MQLGARWRVGEEPHRGVPPRLHGAIAEQELNHPEAHSWTLTFLEGRPRCALDHIVLVTEDAAGSIQVLPLDAPDWSATGGRASDPAAHTESAAHVLPSDSDTEDDDDWLS